MNLKCRSCRTSIPRKRRGNHKQRNKLALLSRPNLTLNLCTVSFVLSLSLLPPSPSSLKFLKCSSSRELASVFTDYLRFHFSASAVFRPGRSILDQIRLLSQSISDGFNKPRLCFWAILSTIDFSKAFDSVWHPALFNKLILTGLPPCFARWAQSFLSDRCTCVVYQNHNSCSFRVRRGVPQGFVLGRVFFSLFVNDLLASLSSFVSCSLYDDELAIWFSSLSVPTAVEATQEALIQLEHWSEYWCLPFNPIKCEAYFFSVVPTKLTSSPIFFYSTPSSALMPLQPFLGSSSTALFHFLNMYLC